MCGIIGFHGEGTTYNMRLLEKLVHESAYRGLHSCGFALQAAQDGDWVVAHHGDASVKAMFSAIPAEGKFTLLYHTRYSTSGIGAQWPQPVVARNTIHGEHAIVMNGVISQDLNDKWPRPDGFTRDWETQNDAEIAMRFIMHGEAGMHGGSYALGFMKTGHCDAWFLRNGDRPLYVYADDEVRVVASTADILRRCGKGGSLMPPGVQYRISSNNYTPVPHLFGHTIDLQAPAPSILKPCSLP